MKSKLTGRRPVSFFGLLLSFCVLGVGYAHHGFTNHFDPDGEVTIQGTVTEYKFINPHVLIHVDVDTEQGGTERWLVESSGISTYLREGGLTSSSLKPGDRVRVVGHPSRSGENAMRLKVIVLPNGEEVRRTSPYQPIPFLENQ